MEPPASPSVAALQSFHTLVFDPRGGERLVRIDVPYWFARRFAWLGQLTFLDDTEFDPDAISLTVNFIEARGPGLVVEHRHTGGGQFLS